jgi:hypothetical protein
VHPSSTEYDGADPEEKHGNPSPEKHFLCKKQFFTHFLHVLKARIERSTSMLHYRIRPPAKLEILDDASQTIDIGTLIVDSG